MWAHFLCLCFRPFQWYIGGSFFINFNTCTFISKIQDLWMFTSLKVFLSLTIVLDSLAFTFLHFWKWFNFKTLSQLAPIFTPYPWSWIQFTVITTFEHLFKHACSTIIGMLPWSLHGSHIILQHLDDRCNKIIMHPLNIHILFYIYLLFLVFF